MSRKRLFLMLMVAAVTTSILVIGGFSSGNTNPVGSTSLDIPDTILSHEVVYAKTQENSVCYFGNRPKLILKTHEETLEAFLDSSTPTQIRAELERLGLAGKLNLSFVGPSVSTDEILMRVQRANEINAIDGCPDRMEPISRVVATQSNERPVFAAITNDDAVLYSDDNAQSVWLKAPSYGSSQSGHSNFLNSVETNDGSIIQNGFHLKGAGEDFAWVAFTDADEYGYWPEEYESLEYVAEDWYFFTNTYTDSTWWACGENTEVSESYQCNELSESSGTQLVVSYDTSVFFENRNWEYGITPYDYWYESFDIPIYAKNAKLYRNGSPQNWGSERKRILECDKSIVTWDNGTVMGGSLKNSSTAEYNIDLVPYWYECD
jgi:hypothetical protein